MKIAETVARFADQMSMSALQADKLPIPTRLNAVIPRQQIRSYRLY